MYFCILISIFVCVSFFGGFAVRAEHDGFFNLLAMFSSWWRTKVPDHPHERGKQLQTLPPSDRTQRLCWVLRGAGCAGGKDFWVTGLPGKVYHEIFEFWTTQQLELGLCQSLTLPSLGVECIATALEYMQLLVDSIHNSPLTEPTTKAVNLPHVKLRLHRPRFWNFSPASCLS